MIKNLVIGTVVFLNLGILKGDDIIIIEEPNLEGVSLGETSMNGTGCSAGSVFTALDTSTQEILVLFDDYSVEASGTTRIARKNCALSIPVHLPAGVQVSLVTTRYEGYNLLPEGASSVLNSEAFIAGSVGEQATERFDGELYEDFAVEKASAIETEASGCGGDLNIRINSSLRVKTNRFGESALAGITALTASSSPLVQKLKFRKCTH